MRPMQLYDARNIKQAWSEEIRRRLEEVDEREAELVSWDEAKKRIFAPGAVLFGRLMITGEDDLLLLAK